MITLLTLYGYSSETQFKNQFNKNMSGGTKQYAPPSSASIPQKRQIAYKTRGAKTRAGSWYGSNSINMSYPLVL